MHGARSLFVPIVPEARFNPTYKTVLTSPGYLSTRRMLDDLFNSFVDRDGNFVEQFQTTGFDARMWELYLHAYLRESGLEIDWSHSSPDFVAHGESGRVCVEAVTANPTLGQRPPLQLLEHLARTGPQDIRERIAHDYPIKWETVLVPKLQERYWELEHARGLPFVLAVEDFHEAISLLLSSAALSHYLYGLTYGWERDLAGNLIVHPVPINEHVKGKRTIPSGFFSLPGAEYVSGVLFSNSGTVAKFNRMGYLLGYRSEGVIMIRVGTRYDHDPNAAEPLPFAYKVGDPRFPENWGQGLSFFHNPRAVHPLPHAILPNISHHWLGNDDLLNSSIPDFQPIASITQILMTRGQTTDLQTPDDR